MRLPRDLSGRDLDGLKPYPEMRDSGVESLGEVPEHWEVRSLGTLGRFFKGSGGTKADETDVGVPCVRYGDLYTGHQFRITESKACVAPDRAGAYTPIHIYSGELKRLAIPLPPLPEQTAIGRFLDDADRRIRRSISAKQKLIELLEEQKRATIHQAVTGQIDVRTGQPYPAYENSGVEWLGKVPKHWERRRLKTLLRVIDRRSSTGGETLLSLRRDHGVVVYSEHFARPPQVEPWWATSGSL